MEYPYFKGLEADRYSFYRVPKALVKADLFQKMSGDAKLLYAVLLDRMSLSIKNGWQDKHGNAYIICTIEEVMDSIHCARQKAVKLLDELEQEFRLIERRRQGLGKPNLLYVKDLYAGLSQSNYWKYENHTSGGLKNELPGVLKSNGSNTEKINKTDNNETDLIYPAELQEEEQYRRYFKEALELEILEQGYPADKAVLYEILELLVETVTSKSATPFYYIVVLLQLTIITPWLVKTIKKRGSLEKLLWVITPAYLVYIYIFNFQCGKSPMFYEVLFPAWFGFYYLGVQVKCGRTVRGSISWLTVAFIYSFFEALFLRYFGLSRGFYTSQITIGSFLYSLALICLIINYQDKTCCFLSRVGDCSYGIFYIHMFVLFFAGKVVDFIGVTDIWLAYWGIRFMITSIVSFVIVRGTQIVLGKHKQLLRWIGFI